MEAVGAFHVQALWGVRTQGFQYVASVLRITFKMNLTSNAFLTRVLPLRRGSWAMTVVRLVRMDSITTVPLVFDQRVNLYPSFKIAVSLVKQELITPRRFTVEHWINVILAHLASAVRMVALLAPTAPKTTC